VEHLVTAEDGCYVDATLGGGGHAAALLERLPPAGRVMGIDQDEEALDAVRVRLAADIRKGRLQVIQGNFANLEALLVGNGIDQIDGLLLDLGVSSHQLDVPERGFSFMNEGPLDMRMDPMTGRSADEVVNEWDAFQLTKVIRSYGEEPRAVRVSQALVAARPLHTTAEVSAVIQNIVPGTDLMKTLARVFQAIRIAVNGELETLEEVLAAAVGMIRIGGRIAVISYHSLEDRRVKRFLRYGNLEGKPVRDLYGNLLSPFRPLSNKPFLADDRETAVNPRARSARLRVSERVPMDVGESRFQ